MGGGKEQTCDWNFYSFSLVSKAGFQRSVARDAIPSTESRRNIHCRSRSEMMRHSRSTLAAPEDRVEGRIQESSNSIRGRPSCVYMVHRIVHVAGASSPGFSETEWKCAMSTATMPEGDDLPHLTCVICPHLHGATTFSSSALIASNNFTRSLSQAISTPPLLSASHPHLVPVLFLHLSLCHPNKLHLCRDVQRITRRLNRHGSTMTSDDSDLSAERLTADLVGVASQLLGDRPFILVGHSMGVRIRHCHLFSRSSNCGSVPPISSPSLLLPSGAPTQA